MNQRAELHAARVQLAESYNQILSEFLELKHIGNYDIKRLIGHGAFGKVYLARHSFTHTKVVLKSASKSEPNLAREIHHHRQLVHPHIARLYEYIVTEDKVWLVLEYCSGSELYTYLVHNGKFDVETEIPRIFAQLCGAVAYAHSKNVAHRDLKLENILLDKHKNVKLVDFGFTRETDSRSLLETICGTNCYMAPEMLRNQRYSGTAVDVWALGVILYTLVYGELPFEEENDSDTKQKILVHEPSYPNKSLEGHPVVALLRQMLQKDFRKRPTVMDILDHPYLLLFAMEQKSILLAKQLEPAPLTTRAELKLMRRLKAANIDCAAVRDSVLGKKCDSLMGLWYLSYELDQKRHHKTKTPRSHSRVNISRLGSISSRRSSKRASMVADEYSVFRPQRHSISSNRSNRSLSRLSVPSRSNTMSSLHNVVSTLPSPVHHPTSLSPPSPLPVTSTPVKRGRSTTLSQLPTHNVQKDNNGSLAPSSPHTTITSDKQLRKFGETCKAVFFKYMRPKRGTKKDVECEGKSSSPSSRISISTLPNDTKPNRKEDDKFLVRNGSLERTHSQQYRSWSFDASRSDGDSEDFRKKRRPVSGISQLSQFSNLSNISSTGSIVSSQYNTIRPPMPRNSTSSSVSSLFKRSHSKTSSTSSASQHTTSSTARKSRQSQGALKPTIRNRTKRFHDAAVFSPRIHITRNRKSASLTVSTTRDRNRGSTGNVPVVAEESEGQSEGFEEGDDVGVHNNVQNNYL